MPAYPEAANTGKPVMIATGVVNDVPGGRVVVVAGIFVQVHLLPQDRNMATLSQKKGTYWKDQLEHPRRAET